MPYISTTIPDEDLIRDCNSGLSMTAIATKYGIGRKAVRRRLNNVGLTADVRLKIRTDVVYMTADARHKRHLEAQLRYRLKNPERHYETTRDRSLRRLYGISTEDVNGMLAAQDGRCAICGSEADRAAIAKMKQSLHVDHDHKTGAVRGLLCFSCNMGIGKFKDDPELLVKAVAYMLPDDPDRLTDAIAYLTAFLKKRKLVAVG